MSTVVGSIFTTVEEGQEIDRAEEMGYFAFGMFNSSSEGDCLCNAGGSTIVCLFERGAMQFDEDLLQNGRASIETLVRMGMGIGHATRKQPFA